MKMLSLPRLVAVLGVAALWMLVSPAPAASIVLDFAELPDEGGITATGTGGIQGTGSLTVAGETILLFDRIQAGALGNFSGLGSATRHVRGRFNLRAM